MDRIEQHDTRTERAFSRAARSGAAPRDNVATHLAACGSGVTALTQDAQTLNKNGSSQLAAACQVLAFQRKWFVVLIHTMRAMKLKTTQLSCIVAALLGAAQQLPAITYNDTELLLVFRKDTFNDAIFNIGSVSNYLGKANGTVINVTNFSLSAVTANFGSANLSGVNVSILAVTANNPSIQRHAWLTCGDTNATPTDVTGSKFGTIWSKVNGVGATAANASGNSSTNYYSVSTSDASSYTYVASNGGSAPDLIPTLGGTSPFAVDGAIPLTLRFFDVLASTTIPKPNSVQIGTFTITAGGVITFTAGTGGGTPAPTITSNPTNVTVFSGGVASFAVGASGSSLSYQWYSNNIAISGATSANYSFTARTNANGAGFKAVVSNSGGSVTSTVATVTVNLPSAARLTNFAKATATAPFTLNFVGTANAYYEIQSSTNISSPANWTTIAFITNGAGGTASFVDTTATNRPMQFYRAIAR